MNHQRRLPFLLLLFLVKPVWGESVDRTAVISSTELRCSMVSQQDQERLFFRLELDWPRGELVHFRENRPGRRVMVSHQAGSLTWQWGEDILPGVTIIDRYRLDETTLAVEATSMAAGESDPESATRYRGACQPASPKARDSVPPGD